MKKAILVIFLCIAVLAPLSAQSWRSIVGGGQPGFLDVAIISSIVVDFGGYITVLVGDFTYDDPYTSLALMSIGSLVMTGGGLVWNICLDARQGQIEAGGISVSAPDQAGAWTFTLLSVGCTAGAVVSGAVISDSFTAFIVSAVFSLAAEVFEYVNFTGPRVKWSAELYAASQSAATSFERPEILPVVNASWNAATKTPDLTLGLDFAL
jgi:hypothetical protein